MDPRAGLGDGVSALSEFRRSDVVRLLQELEARLASRGVSLDIQIIGGAALLLHGLLDRATTDVDAQYTPSGVVDAVAADMSQEYGLPPKC